MPPEEHPLLLRNVRRESLLAPYHHYSEAGNGLKINRTWKHEGIAGGEGEENNITEEKT